MTKDLDELVGADLEPDERGRLRRVHDMLVIAGPPPELSPELEAGPTLAMTIGRRRRRVRRGALLLAAAIAVLALAFTAGYVSGNRGGGGGATTVQTLRLTGTAAAPNAFASLALQPVDTSGNWPMQLAATGLPKLPPNGYYEVFLVRDGEIYAPCGSFIVAGTKSGVSVHLNAPYGLRRGDSWVVTRQLPGQHKPGQVVLQPVA